MRPSLKQGDYLYNFEVIQYSTVDTEGKNLYSWTEPAQIAYLGIDGKAIGSVTEYYARSKTETQKPTTSEVKDDNGIVLSEAWGTTFTAPNKDLPYLWNYEVSKYNDTNNTQAATTNPVIIAYYTENGRSIKSIQNYYLINTGTKPTSKPTISAANSGIEPDVWYKTAPKTTEINRFLWNSEIVTYLESDGVTETSGDPTEPACIGTHGSGVKQIMTYERSLTYAQWTQAQSNKDSAYTDIGHSELWWTKEGSASGENIPNTHIAVGDTAYLIGNVSDRFADADKTIKQTITIYGIVTKVENSGITMTTSQVVWGGTHGAQGNDGRGIIEVVEWYQATSFDKEDDNNKLNDNNWKNNISDTTFGEDDKYLWNYEVIKYSSTPLEESTDPAVIATYSKDGDNGRGIQSIENYYQLRSDENSPATPSSTISAPPTGESPAVNTWYNAPVQTTAINKYLWNCEKITYDDGSDPTFTTPARIGTHGTPGTNYTNLMITATSQTFVKDPNNNDSITPGTITLTPNLYGDLKNKSVTWYQGNTSIATNENIYTNGNQLIIKSGAFGTAKSLTFEARAKINDSDTNYYDDEFTIYLLTEGLNGTPGGKGDPGDNAISAFLTDASISFSADKDGYVAAGVQKMTTVKIFNGATEVSGVKITKVTAQSGFNYDYTTTTDTLKITTSKSQLGNANSTSGQITITAQTTINDMVKTFTLGLSWDKTNTGATGNDGYTPIKGIDYFDGTDGADGTSIVWKGNFNSAPSNPENGWAYYNTQSKASYVYQSGSWYQMSIDGVDGQDGNDGISIVWKGESSSAPSNPQINWVYKDTDDGKVYIYNGNAWELMVLDGSDGQDGTDGVDGLSVFITYNDSITNPGAPTGDGTTKGWHTNATSTSIWMSQKVAENVNSGTWGAPIKIKGEAGPQGNDGLGVKPVNTRIRTQSLSWWREHSLPSNTDKNWTTDAGQGYVNTHLNIGDTAYISGIATYGDGLTMNVVLYGKVENVIETTDTANGAVVLASLYLIEGGEKGDPGNEGSGITTEAEVYQLSDINGETLIDDNWKIKNNLGIFPNDGKDHLWRCLKQAWNNGNTTFTTPILLSDYEMGTLFAQIEGLTIAEWCEKYDRTLINGSTIATGTITAKQINTEGLSAEYIQSSDYSDALSGSIGSLVFTERQDGTTYKVGLKQSSLPPKIAIPSEYNGKPVVEIDGGSFSYGKDIIKTLAIPASVTIIPFGFLDGYSVLEELHIPVHNVQLEGAYGVYFGNWFGMRDYESYEKLPTTTLSKVYLLGREGNNTVPRDYFYISKQYNGEFYVYLTPTIINLDIEAFSFFDCANVVYYYGQITDFGDNLGFIAFERLEEPYVFPSFSDGFRISSKDNEPMINSPHFKVTQNGKVVANKGDIAGWKIEKDALYKSVNGISSGMCSITASDKPNSDAALSSGFYYKVNDDRQTCTITSKGTCTDLNINIPSYIDGYKVTGIDNSAFQGQKTLTSVTIPDSVINIGERAFENCTALTSVIISDSVVSIGDWAFRKCSALISITIPNSVTSIGSYMVGDCTSLTSVTIGDSITKISNAAFYNCSSLTSIVIPDSVTEIGIFAFQGCSSLTSITIPDSVTKIDIMAFFNCSSLKNIVIPESVISMGYSIFGSIDDNFIIYCCCASKPDGWDDNWNRVGSTNEKYDVIWGHIRHNIQSIISGQSPPRFYAGSSISIPDFAEDAKFMVLEDGSLYAEAAKVKGSIETSEGVIGNWILDGDKLYSPKTSEEPGNGTGMAQHTHSASPILWAGYGGYGDQPYDHKIYIEEQLKEQGKTEEEIAEAIQNDPWWDHTQFSVDVSGYMRTKSGSIGNLKIEGGGLSYDKDESIVYSLNETGLNIVGSGANIRVGSIMLGYDDISGETALKTTGPFVLQGDNSTRIELMKRFSDGGIERTGYVFAYFMITGKDSYGKGIGKIWLEASGSAPLYSETYSVSWRSASASGTESFTIPANKTVSDEVSILTESYFGVELKSSTGEWSEKLTTEDETEAKEHGVLVGGYHHVESAENIYITGNLVPNIGATTSGSSGGGYNLGSSVGGKFWNTVYARTPEIDYSDRNKKNTIKQLSDVHEEIFDALKPVSYKFNQSNNNRTHIGLIAQDVKEAVENTGLTTQDFAAYCEWKNENGSTGCGLRYGEFVALNTWQIQKLKARVKQAEETIELQDIYIKKLEERIEKLEEKLL